MAHRWRGRRVTALLLIAITLITTGCSGGRGDLLRSTAGRVSVVVIGDSLSTGFATPGHPWTTDADALYARQGRVVRFVNVAENGAGYTAAGVNGDTFLDEAAKAVGAGSQIVLLFGSDNDVGHPDLAQAVRTTLARVRLVAPHAAIVVVGPPAPPAQQRAPLRAMSTVLRAATTAVGGQFVDPLALDWFEGATAADVAEDNEHPNARGEQFLAGQLTAVLEPTVRALTRA